MLIVISILRKEKLGKLKILNKIFEAEISVIPVMFLLEKSKKKKSLDVNVKDKRKT